MSDVLARIRVKEEHGIRRFLYPLSAVVPLKQKINPATLGLISTDGTSLPLQAAATVSKSGGHYRLDFGLSLAPFSEQVLSLVADAPHVSLDDALSVTVQEDAGLQNVQQRFAITIGRDASIQQVVYDGVSHLRGPSAIRRNGEGMDAVEAETGENDPLRSNGAMTAGLSAYGRYSDVKLAALDTEISACKSWATMTHWLSMTQSNDEVVFALPFAAVSPTLIYDIGLDGVYGKLETKNEDRMTWRMKFNGNAAVDWSVTTKERLDYAGTMTRTQSQSRRWFHLIDGSKSLAVAITHIPKSCEEAVVRLRSDGDVRVGFRMGNKKEERAKFGVCYHFLNDIPAIAAATNPQSILLPPTVEVLPA